MAPPKTRESLHCITDSNHRLVTLGVIALGLLCAQCGESDGEGGATGGAGGGTGGFGGSGATAGAGGAAGSGATAGTSGSGGAGGAGGAAGAGTGGSAGGAGGAGAAGTGAGGTGGSAGGGTAGNGPTVYFTGFPGVVTQGGTTTLSWSAPGADECFAGGAWSGTKSSSGIETISDPNDSQPYTLTCSNADGTTTHGVRLHVTDEPTRSYFEDADVGYGEAPAGTPTLAPLEWPRLALVEGPVINKDPEQYSKYDAISTHVWQKGFVPSIQAIRPEILYFFHVAPEEHQLNNMPFTDTGAGTSLGPVKGTGVMYAGHWLYFAGTLLTQDLGAGGTTIHVQDASVFEPGQYAVIYDAPAGSFENAEHVLVQSVNTTTGQVTLGARGFKSDTSAHAQGSVMAQHKQGWDQGSTESWSYNLSSACPRDANGKTFAEAEVEWIVENLDKDGDGGAIPGIRVDGVYFDADPYFAEGQSLDVDNDLDPDGGFAAAVNLWGEGMESFYQQLADALPGKMLIGGDRHARGRALNGTQMESCPTDSYGNPSNPTYETFDSVLALYTFRLHHGRRAPEYTDVFSRLSTALYPLGSVTPGTNRSFRIAFGFTLLDDGFYAQEDNQGGYDPWWDEYAVDVNPGSATYGHAVESTPTDESAIRAHKGWLGQPLSPRRRVYDPGDYPPANELVPNGGFETGISGWTGNNVTLSSGTSAAEVFEGTSSLRTSTQQSPSTALGGARIVGPAVQVESGQPYSVSFMVRSSQERQITAKFGWSMRSQSVLVSPAWRRIILTTTAAQAETRQLILEIGRENTEVWLDDVHVVEGHLGILRRDYEHGIVVVNATGGPANVALGGTFLRILGTGQDPINDGASLDQVTIPSYDAAVLVRPAQ